MSKNIMLRAMYVVGRVFEIVERQLREEGVATQGMFGRKVSRLRLVRPSPEGDNQPSESADSTRVEYAIPLTDNDGQFFAPQAIAAVLVSIGKVSGGFSCSLGAGLSFGTTVSIDVVLWSSAVVANDRVTALRAELEALQLTLKQEIIFAALTPASVEFLVANDNPADEELAG